LQDDVEDDVAGAPLVEGARARAPGDQHQRQGDDGQDEQRPEGEARADPDGGDHQADRDRALHQHGARRQTHGAQVGDVLAHGVNQIAVAGGGERGGGGGGGGGGGAAP